jgi:hypothetical protein
MAKREPANGQAQVRGQSQRDDSWAAMSHRHAGHILPSVAASPAAPC